MSCGSQPSPGTQSTQASTTGTTYGSTVTYQCNTGYETSGGLTLTCQANGQWSASSGPACTG